MNAAGEEIQGRELPVPKEPQKRREDAVRSHTCLRLIGASAASWEKGETKIIRGEVQTAMP